MASHDIALMAHLMRRAGFGAPRDELEARVARGYEATVEELVNPPAQQPDVDLDILERYLPEAEELNGLQSSQVAWVYRMINTERPLQEKMALFWHGVLCTGFAKVDHPRVQTWNLNMYREYGMGNYRDLMVELSRDPAMIFMLDNVENHKEAINENYGRELLELFSMGAGRDGNANYTEDDVKTCARAFTGWSLEPTMPSAAYGRFMWKWRYDPTDHDNSVKTFLGETGKWNGDDIVDIVVRQPATARFLSRLLYDFFVADEPFVPAWQHTPPRDLDAIRTLEKAYMDNNGELRPVLKTLFNSDFFKDARFQKVKSPVDMVIGTLRLVKDHNEVKPGLFHDVTTKITWMGMDLHNPPSVEGWNTGRHWINTGSLVERINFAADEVGNVGLPGIKLIVDRLSDGSSTLSPEEFVDSCLDLIGPLEASEKTRNSLIEHTRAGGELRRDSEEARSTLARRVSEMLQLIVATAEFQYC